MLLYITFYVSVATILCSSLIYYAERGTYDRELGAWLRDAYYECQILVKTNPPALLNASYDLKSGREHLSEPQYCVFMEDESAGLPYGQAYFLCPYRYKRRNLVCTARVEMSPFSNIPATLWWCLVSMTTVGYGDMYPVGTIGQLLGLVIVLSGVIVIVLPITVVGSNFSAVYRYMILAERKEKLKKQRELKVRKMTEKRRNSVY